MTGSPSSDPNQSPRGDARRPEEPHSTDLSSHVISVPKPGDLLNRYFAGLVEQVLQGKLGVAEPEVSDYATNVLVRFSFTDGTPAVRSLTDSPIPEVADMLFEAETRVGHRRRQALQSIGDHTLFWSGLYPESLEKFKAPERKDFFVDFPAQGSRAYYLASTVLPDKEIAPDETPNSTLALVSNYFKLLTYAFGEVRRQFQADDPVPGKIIV